MKILYTVNATPKSESILPFVVELARRWRAEVLLARAFDATEGTGDPLALVTDTFRQRLLRSGDAYLRDLKQRFQEIPCRTYRLDGPAGECIRQLAVDESVDLLVMASHGHTGFVRWLWGSLAESLARVAPCPVMLVRRDTPAQIQQVLVPIDGSQPSWNVLERLYRFVETKQTRITLLHCGGLTEAEERDDPAARVQLHRLRSELKQHVEGKPWLHLEFAFAPAPEGIHQWLASHLCDLVAMSTHGREGFAHLWTGSVMEQVARNATCPLLIFPPALVQPRTASA